MLTRDGEVYTFETSLIGGVIMKHCFNYGQYRKYREAIGEDTSRPELVNRIKNHPAIGTAFQREDGTIGIIEIVSKHWWFGYYEHIVYRMHNTKSHGTGVYRNISCVCESIKESAEEFLTYKILNPSEVPPETIKLDD